MSGSGSPLQTGKSRAGTSSRPAEKWEVPVPPSLSQQQDEFVPFTVIICNIELCKATPVESQGLDFVHSSH